jgi:hypothetical protein
VGGSFAELKMHTYELAGFQWDSRGWLLRAIPYTDPELMHPEDLVWPVGINNVKGRAHRPYTLWGLRRALRQLQELGYEACRGGPAGIESCGDPSVLVERRPLAG